MPTVGFVYITSNPKRTVLYTGASSELPERVYKHKIGYYDGFAKKYCCYDLVWFERFETIGAALQKEKQIKEWKREWKWELVKKMNPDLKDLSKKWFLGKNEQGPEFRFIVRKRYGSK